MSYDSSPSPAGNMKIPHLAFIASVSNPVFPPLNIIKKVNKIEKGSNKQSEEARSRPQN